MKQPKFVVNPIAIIVLVVIFMFAAVAAVTVGMIR